MHVFTRDIETRNFKALAGMPVPPKYNTPSARRSIADKYGQDIIKEITHRNLNDFRSLLSGSSDDKVAQLSALCDEQAKKIETLEKENQKLRSKQANRAETAAQHG